MAQVAQNLRSVLQSSLIQVMDAAKIQASHVADATLAYEKSVMNAGAAANASNPKFNALVFDLEKLGYSAKNAQVWSGRWTAS